MKQFVDVLLTPVNTPIFFSRRRGPKANTKEKKKKTNQVTPLGETPSSCIDTNSASDIPLENQAVRAKTRARIDRVDDLSSSLKVRFPQAQTVGSKSYSIQDLIHA